MKKRYQASCLCGKVTFEVKGFSQQAANCYCTMCRKFHGAAFGTLVGVSDLSFTSGKEYLKEYEGSNASIRTFCQNCGSSIGFRTKGAAESQMEVAIALFDEEIPVAIDAQIYTNYKACWSAVNPQLTEFKEAREG